MTSICEPPTCMCSRMRRPPCLAIVALLGGKYWSWGWLDPLMGIVGAVLVGVWSAGLIRATSRVLLDREMDHALVDEIRETRSKPTATHTSATCTCGASAGQALRVHRRSGDARVTHSQRLPRATPPARRTGSHHRRSAKVRVTGSGVFFRPLEIRET